MQHNQFATDLAARIEAAPYGSRELSDAVLMACGWKFQAGQSPPTGAAWDGTNRSSYWHAPDGKSIIEGRQPDPTRSETDALALARGRRLIIYLDEDGQATVVIAPGRRSSAPAVSARARTLALSISAALVRSLTS